MTFTYNSTDLSTNLAKIRRRIGDVESADPLLTDEEINAASSASSNNNLAAALCCEWIAAGFARKADKSVGPLSITLHQKYDQYIALASVLRLEDAYSTLPHAGGISISEKETAEEDTDRVPPSFTVDGMDSEMVSTFNPGGNTVSST